MPYRPEKSYTDLRQQTIRKRNAMSLGAIVQSNREILNQIRSLPEYKAAKCIFCFIGHMMELDTLPLILAALEEGKRVAVPRYESGGQMRAYEIRGRRDLRASRTRVMQPRMNCPQVTPMEVDLAIVPAICCDRHCNRLGYTRGYYAEYLNNGWFKPAAAPCREVFLYDSLPDEIGGTAVDLVVTEHKVYRRRYN